MGIILTHFHRRKMYSLLVIIRSVFTYQTDTRKLGNSMKQNIFGVQYCQILVKSIALCCSHNLFIRTVSSIHQLTAV